MSGNYRATAGINCYDAIVDVYVPILSLSDDVAIGIFDFLSAPSDNIIYIQTKIFPYSFLSQFCGMNFIQVQD
jgi:hypothetical protein